MANRKKSKSKKGSSQKPKAGGNDNSGLPGAQRRRNFKNFEKLADYAKGLVYLIVRLREEDGQSYWQNLGTGFLIGKNRLMTCYHCINDEKHEDVAMAQHKDGDIYLMAQKDEHGGFHRVGMTATVGKELFLYPDIDTAIFHLDDSFYLVDGDYYKHPDMYLELSKEKKNIGSEMGILGYPFANLTFDAAGEVDLSEVYIRADSGVINTSYQVEGMHVYESTTAFNPGNSGGPILDTKTGAVIGMVKGYRPVPMHWVEDVIPAGENGNEEEVKQTYRLRTIYSYGISSQTLVQLADDHQLATN